MLVSVIIRTLNEESNIGELLGSVARQSAENFEIEVIIVDSGSDDKTLEIAKSFGARIHCIEKENFTFGRSLNLGCRIAEGEFLVFISGHCIPADDLWIENLISPLRGGCHYTYGRQIGKDTTKFSEKQLFNKYFPSESKIPQDGFFCNNANAALRKDVWLKYKFDEELTGCEDMYLAKQIVSEGHKIGYVAEACVYHIHNETWPQIRNRYEREAIALQRIMPEIQVTVRDTFKYILAGIVGDVRASVDLGLGLKEINSIIRFRFAQYIGTYKGNHMLRKLSREMKEKYFYPGTSNMDINNKID